ncbi:MAG: ABC transporter permease [Clostridiales bacterium]|nr:ABC transporter permease [Clostridiales bacterium]
MSNLIKAERYKLFHRLSFWLGCIAMLGFGILLGFDCLETRNASILEVIPTNNLSDYFSGMIADSLILTVLVPPLLSFIIGREFSTRIITAEISSGHSRREIFFSKLIVHVLACDFIMLLFPIGGLIRYGYKFGTEDLMLNILKILRTCGNIFVVYSAIFMISILIAFIFKSGLISGITSAIVWFCLSWVYGIEFQSNTKMIRMANPNYYIRRISDMGSYLNHSKVFDIPAVLGSIIWIAVCSILMWYLFRKRDLK